MHLERKQTQFLIQVTKFRVPSRLHVLNIFQVYLPTFMFVIVSWVSFLVKPEVVPGRMAMLVTLFLVLINIFNSVRSVSP